MDDVLSEGEHRGGGVRWAVAILAMLIATPVGYAIAHGIGSGDRSTTETIVPASQCAPEASEAFEAQGLPAPENFGPECPSADVAASYADEAAGLRERGLSALLESAEDRGEPETSADAAQQEAMRDELEALQAADEEGEGQ